MSKIQGYYFRIFVVLEHATPGGAACSVYIPYRYLFVSFEHLSGERVEYRCISPPIHFILIRL